ncbi:hypothetical protein Ccrd_020257, partial [Cynara cardunculus var. scolymus]
MVPKVEGNARYLSIFNIYAIFRLARSKFKVGPCGLGEDLGFIVPKPLPVSCRSELPASGQHNRPNYPHGTRRNSKKLAVLASIQQQKTTRETGMIIAVTVGFLFLGRHPLRRRELRAAGVERAHRHSR